MLLAANHLPDDVRGVLEKVGGLLLTPHAGKAHYELVDFLTEQGFFVECEHPIYFSHGSQERIDIMAHRDGYILAIEVDARFKRKSVTRLQRLKDDRVFLILCLLQGKKSRLPEGIDAIVVPEGGCCES